MQTGRRGLQLRAVKHFLPPSQSLGPDSQTVIKSFGVIFPPHTCVHTLLLIVFSLKLNLFTWQLLLLEIN